MAKFLGAAEHVVVACFSGLIAGLVTLIPMGIIWVLALSAPGGLVGTDLSRVILLYIPGAAAVLVAVASLVAPERTSAAFGRVVQWLWRSVKHAWHQWPQ